MFFSIVVQYIKAKIKVMMRHIEVNIKSGKNNYTQKWLVSDFITVKSCQYPYCSHLVAVLLSSEYFNVYDWPMKTTTKT